MTRIENEKQYLSAMTRIEELLKVVTDETQEDDKYSKEFSWPGAVVHTEVGRYPLDSIPEDWPEQCRKRFGSKMLIAVDCTANKEALHAWEVQEAGEGHGGYNPYDTDWENIKFFYGQNHFNERLSDAD